MCINVLCHKILMIVCVFSPAVLPRGELTSDTRRKAASQEEGKEVKDVQDR